MRRCALFFSGIDLENAFKAADAITWLCAFQTHGCYVLTTMHIEMGQELATYWLTLADWCEAPSMVALSATCADVHYSVLRVRVYDEEEVRE